MKKLLIIALVIGVLIGGYLLFRLSPILTTDNAGAEKVVLLHGLGRTEMAMLFLESALVEAGYDVHSIGYPSTDQAPDALLALVSDKIDDCCSEPQETVHFVGHSLGGLLIRAYLEQTQPTTLGRVVLLGVPNKGSPLADLDPDEPLPNTLLEWAGPTAKALTTGVNGFPASLSPPYYPVGVIAGTRDSVVSNKWIPLPNDGMVSVESARLDGMADFLAFPVGHWELRSDSRVARQMIAFLRDGRFDHADADQEQRQAE